jgi:hypothetical protein
VMTRNPLNIVLSQGAEGRRDAERLGCSDPMTVAH